MASGAVKAVAAAEAEVDARPGEAGLGEAGLGDAGLGDAAPGDRIVAAAYDLMSRHGLDGLTVRAVLKQTGVNRRTFYESFSGKDDLVLAVFEQSLRALAADCRARTAAMDDPMERLKFIVLYLALGSAPSDEDPAQKLRRGAALCREHMRLAEARPEDLRTALQPVVALLAEQLAAGIAAGQVRDRPPVRLATLLYNLVSTTVHAEVLAQAASAPDPRRQAQLTEDIWEFCLGGIAA